MNIVFDIDGVLADFVWGFTCLAESLFPNAGIQAIHTSEQQTWNFGNIMQKWHENETWSKLIQIPHWWESLLPLVPGETFSRIDRLARTHNVFFCTNRVSAAGSIAEQSHRWLIKQGISFPNVIVSSKKGDVSKAVRADYAIDDKWDNAMAIHWISEKTESYLIDRPYNRIAEHPEVGSKKVHRVHDLREMLTRIEIRDSQRKGSRAKD